MALTTDRQKRAARKARLVGLSLRYTENGGYNYALVVTASSVAVGHYLDLDHVEAAIRGYAIDHGFTH